MPVRQIAQQLANRAQQAMQQGGQAVHAFIDTLLLACALLFASVAAACLWATQALCTTKEEAGGRIDTV